MLRRRLYFALGIVCLALGFVGLVLPVMPGFVFFIVALWAFRRSSPALERWLLERSPVAPTLREWEATGAVRRRTKVRILLFLWTALLLSVAIIVRRRAPEWREALSGGRFHPVLTVPGLLVIVGIGVTMYISSRKTLAERELEPPALT